MSSEAEITIEEARELVSDSVRWPRVREFLWNFAPQIHNSRLKNIAGLESLDPEHVEGGAGSAVDVSHLMASARIKKYILSSLGVEPCCHLFPKDDWSRLLLLDGPVLESIVKWLGALAYADSLRRITNGATVRALKAGLHGVYPEVFSWTMYFKGMTAQSGDVKPQPTGVQDVISTGFSLLYSILAPLPECLLHRFKLKLPESFCDSAPLDGTPRNPPQPALNPSFIAKLLKFKFPEAYALCCS